MSRLFDERERAAESLFACREEQLFLERRRGIRALAAWASKAMGHDALTADLYDLDLTAAFVKGADDATLLGRVVTNLKAEGVILPFETVRAAFMKGAASSDA